MRDFTILSTLGIGEAQCLSSPHSLHPEDVWAQLPRFNGGTCYQDKD